MIIGPTKMFYLQSLKINFTYFAQKMWFSCLWLFPVSLILRSKLIF